MIDDDNTLRYAETTLPSNPDKSHNMGIRQKTRLTYPAIFTLFQYLNNPSALMPGGLARL